MYNHHLNYIHKIEKIIFFKVFIFSYIFLFYFKIQITNLLQMENEFK
jgi:hypothetical protein